MVRMVATAAAQPSRDWWLLVDSRAEAALLALELVQRRSQAAPYYTTKPSSEEVLEAREMLVPLDQTVRFPHIFHVAALVVAGSILAMLSEQVVLGAGRVRFPSTNSQAGVLAHWAEATVALVQASLFSGAAAAAAVVMQPEREAMAALAGRTEAAEAEEVLD